MQVASIFLVSTLNPELINFLLAGLIVIPLGLLLKYFNQPTIVAYIITGVLIGKQGFGIITNEEYIHILGEFGLILLLFFIGMEINLPTLVKNWKVPTLGTLIQIIASVLFVAPIGAYLGWSPTRIIVLGFVLSLSSSAVIIKLLQDKNENTTILGQNVISILLMQDVLVVPMIIITGFLSGEGFDIKDLIIQLIGGVLIVGMIIFIYRKKTFKLPFSKAFKKDHEIQVIAALIICFGFSTITSLFGLSAALGAFVGGLLIHASKSTDWFHDSLHSFRVIFLAIFFVSIGLLIDLDFLMENLYSILGLLVTVYLGNHLINAVILKFFRRNWKDSLYGGALLAQIGELSFLIASTAYYGGIIQDYGYKTSILVISLTLLISPIYISTTRKLILK